MEVEKSKLLSDIDDLKESIQTRRLELDSVANSALDQFKENLKAANEQRFSEFSESLKDGIKQFNDAIKEIQIEEKAKIENAKKSEVKFDALIDKIGKTADINEQKNESENDTDSVETK